MLLELLLLLLLLLKVVEGHFCSVFQLSLYYIIRVSGPKLFNTSGSRKLDVIKVWAYKEHIFFFYLLMPWRKERHY